MKWLRAITAAFVIVGVSSGALAQDFTENFDSYAAGSLLHGVGGWKGWNNDPGAAARVSNKHAFSGKNSVEILSTSDLVHEFDLVGGRWNVSVMQYIPSGTAGESYFILLNQYRDGGQDDYDDWSVQTVFNLDAGTLTPWDANVSAAIVYDKWVEVKFAVDLVANTVDEYYNGTLILTWPWDDGGHWTFQALDLFGNNASPVFYDDIKIERYYVYKAVSPEPVDWGISEAMPMMTWMGGDRAIFHNLYLGTTPQLMAADLKARHLDYEFYFPMPLTPCMTYYWRVDEIMADGTVTTGDVWSFRVASNAAHNPDPRNGDKWIDPNTTLTWLQGQSEARYELYFGTDQAAVAARDPSVLKGALNVTSFQPGTLAANTTYYWAVDEIYIIRCPGDVWSFTTAGGPGGGVKAEYFRGTSLAGSPFVTQIEPAVDHLWGVGEVAGGVADVISARWTADLEIAVSDDYTFITTTDDGVRLWLDGERIIDNWTDHGPTDNLNWPIKLDPGIYSLRMDWYERSGGAVAQLSWQSPTMSRRIIPAGPLQPPVHARAFYPVSGDVQVPRDAVLLWTAGDKAVTHDVYFGTDKAAVAAATPTDVDIYRASRTRTDTGFDPGPLEGNTTYFWRVDEVNDAAQASPWKGMVWSFTTAGHLIVDNFETYTNDSPNRLFQTWIDGRGFEPDEYSPMGHPGNGTGSAVGHDIWAPGTTSSTIVETTVVRYGRRSMPMDYNNLNPPYYSEAVRTWATAQDWTVYGRKLLVLHICGRSDNQAARLYVALEDSDGRVAVVTHANDTVVTSADWVTWAIPLSDFADVEFTAIKKMFVGVGSRDMPAKGGAGTIFIDDIAVANLR